MPKPPKEANTKPKVNPFELPEERLATTNEQGKRLYLFPAKVKGFFRRRRDQVYSLLMVFFLSAPWIQFQGAPLILLDIEHRKFVLFGTTFWAHEAPILVMVFLTFTISMGMITALFGRVWCGWACPQTVFIDGIYRRIENWLEGDGISQRRFNDKPMSPKKLGVKTIKWVLFLLVSLLITHSFLAYFVGAEHVLTMMQQSPQENMTSFMVVVISTAVILFNFGWFREQFCIIACPYGRFQSVFMDENSLVVGYDAKRGEPRKKDRKDTDFKGACVNCYRCVQVCPTGIDIRRGTQMECIMCTACVDACNQVMHTLNKAPNLIKLSSENKLKGKKTKYLRPRVYVYITLLLIVINALGYTLSNRQMVPVFAKRQTSPPYLQLDNRQVQNQFTLKIQNQYDTPIDVLFSLSPTQVDAGIMLIQPLLSNRIDPGQSLSHTLFVRFPEQLLESGRYGLSLQKTVVRGEAKQDKTLEVVLLGPI